MSGINNLFIGAENAESFFIGSQECELIYLGNEIVYQKGDFEGIQMKSAVALGMDSGSTYDLKIKSSEPWTLSVDTAVTWLEFSQLTGDSGQTIVTIECNEENQTGSDRSTTITATTANYTATCVVKQVAIHYVPYIHKSTLENNTNYYIDTGIFPTTETKMRFVYMGKGLVASGKFLGFSWGSEEDVYRSATDDSDYRYFGTNNHIYWDYNNSRLENGNFNNYSNGVLYDVEIGNNYVKNNLNETMIVNGTAQTNPPTPNIPIMVNVSCIWLKSLQIWQGQTLVFDGHAAIDEGNNIFGLYDSVSNTWKYNPNIQMTYEENDVIITWTNTGNVYTADVSAILVDDFRVCELRDTYVPTQFQSMTKDYQILLTTSDTVVVKTKNNNTWTVVGTLEIGDTYTNNYGLTVKNFMNDYQIGLEVVDTVYNSVSHQWSWKYRYGTDGESAGGGGAEGGDEE